MDSVLTLVINRIAEATEIIRDRLPDASVYFECINNDPWQDPGKSEFYIVAHQHRRGARISLVPLEEGPAIGLEVYSYRRHLADQIDDDGESVLESYENFQTLGEAGASLIEAISSR